METREKNEINLLINNLQQIQFDIIESGFDITKLSDE